MERDGSSPEEKGRAQSKLAYEKPRLIHYGSVRNLTGGSGGFMGDGGGTMTRGGMM